MSLLLKQNDENSIFYSINSINSINLINSIFILILVSSSGLVGDILSCKYTKFIMNNIYIKHLVAYLTIYLLRTNLFTYNEHPLINLRRSLLLYILFLILMRQNLIFTSILFTLIFLIHFLYEYSKYYNFHNNDDNKNKKNINNILRFLSIIVIILSLIGLVINYYERKNEYGSNFNTLKFILGNISCSK
jgi:hypothetical protein|tara:strand:- start:75 stop:644 length:570 start_codon:yes stop_codon:yes gene_type:complete